jgi:hypothetical protein
VGAEGIVSGDGPVRQPAVVEDLTAQQLQIVRVRFAHVQEVETGFCSGDRLRAAAGEPRAGYDPACTTLAARRAAKVAELAALPRQDAELLGLAHVSVRTLQQWAAACRRAGLLGCVDGHWLRRSGGHPGVSEAVREAIFAVRQETLHRSRMSMASRYRLVADARSHEPEPPSMADDLRPGHGREQSALHASPSSLRLAN